MEVDIVPFDKAVTDTNLSTVLNIFQKFETRDCQLDCNEWKLWQESQFHTCTGTQNRTKRRELKKAFKLSRRVENPEDPGARYKCVTRHAFKLRDVIISAEGGCGGCKFLFLLIKGTLEAQNKELLHSKGLQFAWHDFRFSLEIFDQENGQYSAFEWFIPRSELSSFAAYY
jgi:hypothetical protein